MRQNYVEDDIGAAKADALAERLRSIRDDVVVGLMTDIPDSEVVSEMLAADLVIDATISHAVARLMNELTVVPGRRAVIAQIATDARTGTLGLAFVNAPPEDVGSQADPITMSDVDDDAKEQVYADAALEPYRVFWSPPLSGDEFVPTRGCSIPTFHGSAADLASVAGSLLSLIALHLGQGQSGTHLIALPHSGVRHAHHSIPHGLNVEAIHHVA